MTTRNITSQQQVEELMKEGGKTALIDFWAPWCGPCQAMAPVYEEVAKLMADEPVEFLKVNTQKHPQIASAFNVRSLPTIVAVHDGAVQDSMIGVQDLLSLKKVAERLVSRAQNEGMFSRLLG